MCDTTEFLKTTVRDNKGVLHHITVEENNGIFHITKKKRGKIRFLGQTGLARKAMMVVGLHVAMLKDDIKAVMDFQKGVKYNL